MDGFIIAQKRKTLCREFYLAFHSISGASWGDFLCKPRQKPVWRRGGKNKISAISGAKQL